MRMILCISICLLSNLALAEDKVSTFGQYQGYSTAQYDGLESHSTLVEMPDGTKIALDWFIPLGGPKIGKYPVILEYTPYRRATIHPETGAIQDQSTATLPKFFASHGYIIAKADMRGTGASSGWLLDFMPEIWKDGKDLIDWIAAQPWCDGNVGMMGGSYLGWSQTATASLNPEALKCIVPTVIPLDGYTGEVYPGGIYLQGFLNTWSEWMLPVQRAYYLPDMGVLPTKPAIDEDGDGLLHDEIPLDQNGNGTFLDDGYPPKYADGEKRDHIYFNCIQEHTKNYDYAKWAIHTHFIDSKAPLGYTMFDLAPNAHVKGLSENGLPIYNVGGWHDGFTRGTFELWSTLRDSNPSKLIMFPGYHGVLAGPYYDVVGTTKKEATQVFLNEHLRFFDRHLKGVDNSMEDDAPIQIFVMNGEGWRGEEEWPLARAVQQDYYFTEDHGISCKRPRKGSDDYTVDFTHNSSYGDNGGNRWMGIAGNEPNAPTVRTEKDKQCLTYTSPGMDANMEVTGHPIVTFYASADQPDGDFFVYLEDVSPQGEVILVSEGMLRAGFAALQDNDLIIRNFDIDVTPDLPWHGYEKAMYRPEIFTEEGVVEMVIDLLPTSWVFKKGHSIRVSIAGADFPTFQLHPQLSKANDPAAPDNITPTYTIHRSKKKASRITLPIVPG